MTERGGRRTYARDLIVIGASAGGLEALREVLAPLPADLPAAICVVIHTSSAQPSLLPEILSRAGALRATHALGDEALCPGHIFVAPPNFHLLVATDHVLLGSGPKENGFRPAVDPLFRSAAASHGHRAIGIVLSGGLDDGTAGLAAIKARGGLAIVQNPVTAVATGMPTSAMRNVAVDHVLGPEAIGSMLLRLVDEPPADCVPEPDRVMTREVALAKLAEGNFEDVDLATPSNSPLFRCPDCRGPMREVGDPDVLRFRCHEGHAYSVGSLFAKQVEQNGAALREIVSALREHAALGRRVAERSQLRHDDGFAELVLRQVERVETRARRLTELLHETERDPEVGP